MRNNINMERKRDSEFIVNSLQLNVSSQSRTAKAGSMLLEVDEDMKAR